MNVIWSKRADARIAEIVAYVASSSQSRATALLGIILDVEHQLRRFPYSGALVPEDGAYRQIVVEGYRILYVIDEREIIVMTIVAPRQSLEAAK